jgi:hypothetical protein
MEVGHLPLMTDSVVIAARVDRVAAYLDEPSTMVEWLPSMMEIRDVIGTGAGQQYGWTYKYVGLLLNGQSTVIEHVPNELAVHQTIGTINSVWTFKFEPHDGGTSLTLEVEYSIPIPVLGKLAERLVLRRDKRTLDFALTNVKELLEG